jgi:hypothetical protein
MKMNRPHVQEAAVVDLRHRLNMELDLQSFFGLQVHSCTHWLRPCNSPLPPHLGSYTRPLLVSQDRRHLFVTTWLEGKETGRERMGEGEGAGPREAAGNVDELEINSSGGGKGQEWGKGAQL